MLFNCSNDSSSTPEYKEVMVTIREQVAKHKSTLVPGEPQLNMCDPAVMVSKMGVIWDGLSFRGRGIVGIVTLCHKNHLLQDRPNLSVREYRFWYSGSMRQRAVFCRSRDLSKE